MGPFLAYGGDFDKQCWSLACSLALFLSILDVLTCIFLTSCFGHMVTIVYLHECMVTCMVQILTDFRDLKLLILTTYFWVV